MQQKAWQAVVNVRTKGKGQAWGREQVKGKRGEQRQQTFTNGGIIYEGHT